MTETKTYSNHNLAGILGEALGLEAGAGRSTFSGTYRETLREALEDKSSPKNFTQLLEALRKQNATPSTVLAVEALAAREPERSLQEFARNYGRGETSTG